MSHLATICAAVDTAIASKSIVNMNQLLATLSDDAVLTREQRYRQQHLRHAIVHHRQHQQAQPDAASVERKARLTKGEILL